MADHLKKYEDEWQQAYNSKRELLQYASANKVDPGPDYWRAEYKAKARLDAARGVVSALCES